MGIGTAVFKTLNRLGIDTFKRRSSAHKGQSIAFISAEDFVCLQRDVESRNVLRRDNSAEDPTDFEIGVFDVIELEPDHDPGRFKVGFAANPPSAFGPIVLGPVCRGGENRGHANGCGNARQWIV